MTLNDAVKLLRQSGIESAAEEARMIFELVGGFPRHALIASNPESDSEELLSALERRAAREPLQYILGQVGFYKESYRVSPDCLIPRPDTETLVELAISRIPDGAFFLDLCTGSGCVAISTLKNTKNTRAEAFDISEAALEIARINARENGVSDRIVFTNADVLSKLSPIERPFAILSNPPYVSLSAYESLEPEISFEPRIAFVAGEDGSDFYRALVPVCKELIDPSGFFAFEIGYDQADLSRHLADIHSLTVEIIKDLSGNDRVAVYRFNSDAKTT